MFDPPDGPWEIVRFADSREDDEFIGFEDRPALVRFLREFKSDRTVMLQLRSVLTPQYPVSRLSDDQAIECVAANVAAHHLALRLRRRWYESSDGGGSSQGNSGGSRQALSSQKSNDSPAKPTKSWFSVTVVHEVRGSEKVIDNLTVYCDIPDLGKTSGVTSRNTPHIRFNDLKPGGTGDVLGTSHDEVVWEVVSDID